MSFAGFQGNNNPPGTTGLLSPKRNIGGLVANVTVEEQHDDELEITQQPVEKSADITDHAYKLPARVRVRVGYSPSGSSAGGEVTDAADPVPLPTRYQQYLDMQNNRELLEVQTGKRLYTNMLIRSISMTTDADTENALFLTIGLQEVILVETQTVQVPPNNVQKDPKSTASTANAGTKLATPVDPDTAAYNAAIAAEQKDNAAALARSGF